MMKKCTPEEIEFITPEEAAKVERLAGCLGELVTNWTKNNRDKDGKIDPVILLGGLGRTINAVINTSDCPHCRHQFATMVIDLILDYSNVNRPDVMSMVAMIADVDTMPGKKLDA